MKRTSSRTIDSFFSPVTKKAFQVAVQDSQPETSFPAPSLLHLDENDANSECARNAEHEREIPRATLLTDSASEGTSLVAGSLDIGNFAHKQVDDFSKRRLLESHWQPPENYSFPHSVHNKGGKEEKRYLSHSHLLKFNWLVLSDSQRGLYCKYCALFTTGSVGGYQKNVRLQKLVTRPLTKFARLLGKDGDLPLHEATRYHKEAVEAGKNFLACADAPEKNVANQVSNHRLLQVTENRNRLLPIVESIMFLGRQGIPLRGHRDDGMLIDSSQEASPIANEGNFRELLRFRVSSGDKELEKHLVSTSSRATYISKTTQNELIKCCGEEILARIIQWVQEAGMYSVMFDETTDAAHLSQLCLALRYVHNNVVREDFVQFLDIRSDIGGPDDGTGISEPVLSGRVLGEQVVKALKALGLDLEKCVGIGTDGCSVMVSQVCGAVSKIKHSAPNAVHCPCFNHALNLSLSQSSRVQSIRNAVGVMKEVISFFTASPKRNVVLKSVLGSQLKGLCETRWVERHDSIIRFRDSLGTVAKALDIISGWTEIHSSAKATTLRAAISDGEFLVAVTCLADMLTHTLPLSRLFQKECVDVRTARTALVDTIAVLDNRRVDSAEAFSKLYKDAVDLADDLETEIRSPRINKRQTHRCNAPALDAESYYRTAVYIQLLDNVLTDLKARFTVEAESAYELFMFVPSQTPITKDDDEKSLATIAERYSAFLATNADASTTAKIGHAELRLWHQKWKREAENGAEIPTTAVGALSVCDREVFPLIHTFLQILTTLPVSVASAERSFSALRRLKTWMRSQMGEGRLTGLALLHTHRDIFIDTAKIIERFATEDGRRRRLEFVI